MNKRIMGILMLSFMAIIVGTVAQVYTLKYHMKGELRQIIDRYAPSSEIVQAAQINTDIDSDVQRHLTKVFDEISEKHPSVAQAYLFGTELIDGVMTSIIAAPTHIIEANLVHGFRMGSLYEQPTTIVEAIREMKNTKNLVFTDSYKDIYGIWATALQPIINANGEVFAYFGIDFNVGALIGDIVKTAIILTSISAVLVLVAYLHGRQPSSVDNIVVLPLRRMTTVNRDESQPLPIESVPMLMAPSCRARRTPKPNLNTCITPDIIVLGTPEIRNLSPVPIAPVNITERKSQTAKVIEFKPRASTKRPTMQNIRTTACAA